MSKEKTVAKKQDDTELINETAAGRDDDARADAGEKAAEGAYYKSQKEVDAAFARRLEAERRKWARQLDAVSQASRAQAEGLRQPADMAAQPAAIASPGEYPTAYSASAPLPVIGNTGTGPAAMPPAGGLPPQPGMIPAVGLSVQNANPPVALGETANAQDAAAQANPTFAQVAMRLLAEEEDIKRVYPQFDLESFLSLGEGVQNALISGRSLWSVFSAVYGETLRRQAEDAALERIRDRNASVPDVLRGGGAAGSVGLDYANMPSEQFAKLRKAYEAEMRSGKKVKP